MVIFLYLINPCTSNTPYSCSQTPNDSLVLLNLTLDENVFCRLQIHNFFVVFNPSAEIFPDIFWRFWWKFVINQRQVAVTLNIFSNVLYRYGSITFPTVTLMKCVNQLGPLIQLVFFDDNSSGKHPVDDRSAIFSFPGSGTTYWSWLTPLLL